MWRGDRLNSNKQSPSQAKRETDIPCIAYGFTTNILTLRDYAIQHLGMTFSKGDVWIQLCSVYSDYGIHLFHSNEDILCCTSYSLLLDNKSQPIDTILRYEYYQFRKLLCIANDVPINPLYDEDLSNEEKTKAKLIRNFEPDDWTYQYDRAKRKGWEITVPNFLHLYIDVADYGKDTKNVSTYSAYEQSSRYSQGYLVHDLKKFKKQEHEREKKLQNDSDQTSDL
jgi:hypothetical protein